MFGNCKSCIHSICIASSTPSAGCPQLREALLSTFHPLFASVLGPASCALHARKGKSSAEKAQQRVQLQLISAGASTISFHLASIAFSDQGNPQRSSFRAGVPPWNAHHGQWHTMAHLNLDWPRLRGQQARGDHSEVDLELLLPLGPLRGPGRPGRRRLKVSLDSAEPVRELRVSASGRGLLLVAERACAAVALPHDLLQPCQAEDEAPKGNVLPFLPFLLPVLIEISFSAELSALSALSARSGAGVLCCDTGSSSEHQLREGRLAPLERCSLGHPMQ